MTVICYSEVIRYKVMNDMVELAWEQTVTGLLPCQKAAD